MNSELAAWHTQSKTIHASAFFLLTELCTWSESSEPPYMGSTIWYMFELYLDLLGLIITVLGDDSEVRYRPA